MRTRNTKMGTLRSRLHGMVAMAVFQLLVVGCAQAGFAQGSEPKTFSSPTEACQALDRKSTRLNSSHLKLSRMPSSA